jgi:hypothetical protein
MALAKGMKLPAVKLSGVQHGHAVFGPDGSRFNMLIDFEDVSSLFVTSKDKLKGQASAIAIPSRFV